MRVLRKEKASELQTEPSTQSKGKGLSEEEGMAPAARN